MLCRHGCWFYILKSDIEWTTSVIRKYWPQKASEAAILLSTWFGLDNPLDKFTSNRLEKLLPNLSFKECHNSLFNSPNDCSLIWLPTLIHWWNKLNRIEAKLFVNSIESEVTIKFISISQQHGYIDLQKIKTLGLENSLHPDWKLLINIIDFYIEPTVKNLANALEYIADASEPEIWSFLAIKSPWPLAVHLLRATTKAELITFSRQIRSGLFGDENQWLILETKWKNNGISFEELVNPLFSSEAALVEGVIGYQVDGGENEIISLPALNHMAKYLVDTTYSHIKNKTLRIIGFYGACKGKLNSVDPNVLKSNIISSEKQWYDRDFVIKLENLNPDLLSEFIAFYDCFGKLPKLCFTKQNWKIESVPLEQILNAFDEDSKKLGLLRLAGFWCAAGRKAAINPAVLIPLEKFQEPKYRLAAMLVRMSQQDLSFCEAEQMVGQLVFVTGENGEPQAFEILVSALEHHAKETIALEILLKKLLEIIPEDKWQLRARAETLRQTLLEAKPSGFDEAKLKMMNLPLISF